MKRGILTLRRVHRKMVRYRRREARMDWEIIDQATRANAHPSVFADLIKCARKTDAELQRELDRPYIKNYS